LLNTVLNKADNVRINATVRRLCLTNFTVEKQSVFHILCVCL